MDSELFPKGRFPLRKISMGLDRIGTKSEPVIRNPGDKELKYLATLFGPAVQIIQDGKKSDPSGNWP